MDLHQATWFHVSALPLNSSVTLGKVLELSKPQFSHFYVCLYVYTYIFFKVKKFLLLR